MGDGTSPSWRWHITIMAIAIAMTIADDHGDGVITLPPSARTGPALSAAAARHISWRASWPRRSRRAPPRPSPARPAAGGAAIYSRANPPVSAFRDPDVR
jgi:hypothetical protein